MKKQNRWGGSAAAGGMNYQAAVTAVALAHMARGIPLGWVDDSILDIPTAISAEDGGAGDDIKIELAGSAAVEVQVKKAIPVGRELWKALLDLATAIASSNRIHGVLVVGPHSSFGVRDQLAKDVRRIGDGRTDDLSGVGKRLLEHLDQHNIPRIVCSRLRVKTIHALSDDSGAVDLARAALSQLNVDGHRAWDSIYIHAGKLIEYRGRRTAATVADFLFPGIEPQDPDRSPSATARRLHAWYLEHTKKLTVFGMPHALDFDAAWLRQKITIAKPDSSQALNVSDALKEYHATGGRRRNASEDFDAEGIGWFRNRCVVIGGPGMGKSTLLRRLLRTYTRKSTVAILVRLQSVSQRMRVAGAGFQESMLYLDLTRRTFRPRS